MKERTCPNCHRSFPCLGTQGCWCAALPAVTATGTDCLCPECLRAIALAR